MSRTLRPAQARIFQSTPPVKAATTLGFGSRDRKAISIHAAREGGDENDRFAQPRGKLFQSTPPVKAATLSFLTLPLLLTISIHAAREGGDDAVQHVIISFAFQSTPPVKAATVSARVFRLFTAISIHAAREGGDRSRFPIFRRQNDFNPRRP